MKIHIKHNTNTQQEFQELVIRLGNKNLNSRTKRKIRLQIKRIEERI